MSILIVVGICIFIFLPKLAKATGRWEKWGKVTQMICIGIFQVAALVFCAKVLLKLPYTTRILLPDQIIIFREVVNIIANIMLLAIIIVSWIPDKPSK